MGQETSVAYGDTPTWPLSSASAALGEVAESRGNGVGNEGPIRCRGDG